MNARQRQILARFNQILAFLDANADTIPPTLVARQRQLLSTVVDQITSFTQAQIIRGANAPASQSVASARTTLRDIYLRQLSTIGLQSLMGANAGDPSVPNALQIFTMPTTRTNPLMIIASAKAMLAVALQYPNVFTMAGMNLGAAASAIEALEAAVTARASANRVSQGATQGIKGHIRAGKGAVRIMDVIIRPALSAMPELLTQWQTAKRSAGGPKLGNLAPTVAAPASANSETPSTQTTPPAAVDSAG